SWGGRKNLEKLARSLVNDRVAERGSGQRDLSSGERGTWSSTEWAPKDGLEITICGNWTLTSRIRELLLIGSPHRDDLNHMVLYRRSRTDRGDDRRSNSRQPFRGALPGCVGEGDFMIFQADGLSSGSVERFAGQLVMRCDEWVVNR